MQLTRDCGVQSVKLERLRARLDEFYQTTRTYQTFEEGSDHVDCYQLIHGIMAKLAAQSRKPEFLELGAGKSRFSDYLRANRLDACLDSQDVTRTNEKHLRERRPSVFLDEVHRVLRPRGWHVVICPRYDVPGYVCPSLRHLPKWRQWMISAFISASRLRAAIDRRPRFWINTDPALFHRDWFRDADAVHLVSALDIEAWHRRRGYAIEKLQFAGGTPKERWLKRLITLALACRKPQEAPRSPVI